MGPFTGEKNIGIGNCGKTSLGLVVVRSVSLKPSGDGKWEARYKIKAEGRAGNANPGSVSIQMGQCSNCLAEW